MRNFICALIIFLFQISASNADDNKKGDVIMIANGDFDIFIETSEEEMKPLIDELGINIGGVKIVDLNYLDNLIGKYKPIKTSFGGSAANTAYTLSLLGKKNGIYVVLSDEELSKAFIKNLEDVGIKNYGSVLTDEDRGDDSVMTKVISFISNSKTNSSERTFVAYKGLSADFTKANFDLSHIKDYKILYIEGYIFSPKSRNVIFEAIKEAKKNDVKVLFSPSCPSFVDMYRDDFANIIDKSDILFTNRAEVASLYKDLPMEDAIEKLSKKVEVAIVTNGKNGSMVTYNKGDKKAYINESIDQSQVIDTTGAGDGYLAGFLYGYLNGVNIEESGRIGAIVANNIIQEISGRPTDEMIQKIKSSLKQRDI